ASIAANHRFHQQRPREADGGLAPPASKELAMPHHLVEVSPLLCDRSERVDEPHDRRMHMDRHRRVRAAARQRPNDRGVRRHIEREPAVLDRNGSSEKTLQPEIAPALYRVLSPFVVFPSPRRKPFAREALRRLDDEPPDTGHLRNGVRITTSPSTAMRRNKISSPVRARSVPRSDPRRR